MNHVYKADDWQTYSTDPHWNSGAGPEPDEFEIEVVDQALAALVEADALPHKVYDKDRMLAHRTAVREQFDIPWTGVSPRMQRLIYAINAIAQPRVMVGVGIFCGFTFASNTGAAIGPGACYRAERLIGIEIDAKEADRARRNLATIDEYGQSDIIATDGAPWLRDFNGIIDLLYLDVTDSERKSKSIYFDMLEGSLHSLHGTSLVLAHNSVSSASDLAKYLNYVRDPLNFRESFNMFIDSQGLEVSAGYLGNQA